MKKQNLKGGNQRFNDESDFNSTRKGASSKEKGGKKRFSIYEDFDDEDEFENYEKFKKKRK